VLPLCGQLCATRRVYTDLSTRDSADSPDDETDLSTRLAYTQCYETALSRPRRRVAVIG
jgi:hypothetical protein